jgi:hypothetical protein
MCTDAEVLAVAGIRARHPDLSPAQVRRELARRQYGSALADAAYTPARVRFR